MLRVASYNVHGFVGTDGRRSVARVARVLRELDAQVIALQEVEFEAGEAAPEPVAILAELTGFRAVGAPIDRHGQPFGNALLTTLPVLESRRICLAYPACEPRTALEVRIETGSRPLRVIATHLGLRPGERRYQVRRILEHVSHDERSLTVLVGDFNEWFLMGRPLRWLHARFGRSPAVRSFPSRFPLLALDRIWAHPQQALRGVHAYVGGDARCASDHLPLLAELSLD